jgi:predicted extracellular nuclease
VVQEVENRGILSELAARVNRAANTSYVATSHGSSDPRGIEVGFVWDRGRVQLSESFLLSGREVELAFGKSSPSPGREPLVGIFEIGGRRLTIVGNHLKSKGGDDPLFGVNQPPVRATEVQRKAQARVVRDYVDTLLEKDPEALVLVTGDLNDFQFGEPGEGPDHPVAILEGESAQARLTNLVSREDEEETYTFVFQGNSQVLDHVLVSPSLLGRVGAVDILHFNAGFPAALAGSRATSVRSSDHDPVEVRFQLLRTRF